MVWRKHDVDDNMIGWSHSSPIIGTCQYEMEFANEEVTELTANDIPECHIMRMGMSTYYLHPSFIIIRIKMLQSPTNRKLWSMGDLHCIAPQRDGRTDVSGKMNLESFE